MNKIIYSANVMTQLVERGFMPINHMPNPKYPEYTCWIFEDTEEFEQVLSEVLGKYGSQ